MVINKYKFEYEVPVELLDLNVPTKLNVIANLSDLCVGIPPLIMIYYNNINAIDILNIKNWLAVKIECEKIAQKHFAIETNVIVPAQNNMNTPNN